MWLHKHGWTYYDSNITEICNIISSSNGPNNLALKTDINNLKRVVTELIEHLLTIDMEIKKEDNIMKTFERVIYDIHLINKLRNRQKIDDYEQNIKDEFKSVEQLYGNLKKESTELIEIITSEDKADNYIKKIYEKATNILKHLKNIRSVSKILGAYLGKILPEIDEYKEWVKKQEDATLWAENNIRSWITFEKKETQ